MAARTCPWCDSTDTERLGDAGSLLMTSSWYCRSCHSAFEVIRKRGAEPDDVATDVRPDDTPDDAPDDGRREESR